MTLDSYLAFCAAAAALAFVPGDREVKGGAFATSVGVLFVALAMAYPYFPGSDSRAFQGVSVLLALLRAIEETGSIARAGCTTPGNSSYSIATSSAASALSSLRIMGTQRPPCI